MYGQQYVSSNYPYTETTYTEKDGKLIFNTQFVDIPTNAYLAVVLYKDDMPIGTKLQAYTGQESIDSTFDKVDFDEAKVMLIESFFTMKIVADPETIR